MKRVLLVLGLSFAAPAYALSEAEIARLQTLRDFSLDELQEVEVNLDDVFDMFDALVKARKVSIASGMKQDTASAPAVTTLITAQDIEAMGARTLDEALESVPGLHVGKRGIGYDYIYTLRGIHTNPSPEVLILVNGIPVKNTHDGRVDSAPVAVSMIQRIEVIRGPGSALYGADAFSGVINIITKQAQDIDGTELGAGFGADRERRVWLSHGQQYQDLELAFMLDWQRGDGHNAWVEEDAQTQLDRRFGAVYGAPPVSLAPGEMNASRDLRHARVELGGGHWRWRGSLIDSRDAGNGLGFAQALDPGGYTDAQNLRSDLNYYNAESVSDWVFKAQLSYQYAEVQARHTLFPAGAFAGSFPQGFLWNFALKSRQWRLENSALFSGWQGHKLRIGAGWQDSRLSDIGEQRNWAIDPLSGSPYPLAGMSDFSATNALFLTSDGRRNAFIYLQDTWEIDKNWTLTAGIRYDHFSDFGGTTNPRLALVWKTTPALTSKLLFGSAFRAPTLFETGFNNPLLGIGNPDLQAETINTAELAWDWFATPELHFTLNLFHYQIEDKIGFPGGQIQWANSGKWQGQGLEWEMRWKFSSRAALLLNYAYQNSEDENGTPVVDALRQSAYARLDWMFLPHWFLDLNARWVGDRPRAVNDNRAALEDYFITDVTLRRKDLKGQWNVAFGLRNLFDSDAREPTTVGIGVTHDLPLPGRTWFAELRYRF